MGRVTWSPLAEADLEEIRQKVPGTHSGFGKRCREAGVRPSMSSVGDCYDNAM